MPMPRKPVRSLLRKPQMTLKKAETVLRVDVAKVRKPTRIELKEGDLMKKYFSIKPKSGA